LRGQFKLVSLNSTLYQMMHVWLLSYLKTEVKQRIVAYFYFQTKHKYGNIVQLRSKWIVTNYRQRWRKKYDCFIYLYILHKTTALKDPQGCIYESVLPIRILIEYRVLSKPTLLLIWTSTFGVVTVKLKKWLDKPMKKKGELVAFNSFLSTLKSRQVSFSFTQPH
jgi:hypothetical protein